MGIVAGRQHRRAAGTSTWWGAPPRSCTRRTGSSCPGLVDLHVHVYWGVADLSVEADPTCLGRGVTTVVDADRPAPTLSRGSAAHVVDASRGRVLAYLNISATGQIDPFLGELHDLRFADPERAAAVGRANPDIVVGYKVRVSEMLAGPNGLAGWTAPWRRVGATDLPVMVHIGGTTFDIEEVLSRLRPGDVVTHAYTGWQPGIVTSASRVVPAAREARDRGVRFDVGHGAGRFTWPIAEAALADGFRPTPSVRTSTASTSRPRSTIWPRPSPSSCSWGSRSTRSWRWRRPRRPRPSGRRARGSARWPWARRRTSRSSAWRRAGSR